MNELNEKALFRKDLTVAISESNETFARFLNQLSLSMSTIAQSLAMSFEFMSQIMFNNNYQQKHCQPMKTILVYKVIINKFSYYILILTVDRNSRLVEIYQ